jgi:cell wall-associated NlpC family hydrolase
MGGRDPKIGLDCWGLSQEIMKRYDVLVPDIMETCYDVVKINSHIDNQKSSGNWEEISEPEDGCIVLMAIDEKMPNVVQHIAVYIGDGKIIQTLEKVNSFVVKINDSYWRKRIKGFYKWKNDT